MINYAGVSVASKIVPVAMIFVFPALMSVGDFGTLTLFYSYVWVLAILCSLNLYSGLGRCLYEPDAEAAPLIGTALLLLGAMYAVFSVFWLLAAPHLARPMGLPGELVFFFLPIVAAYILEQLLTQILIYQRRSRVLLILVATRAVGIVGLSVAFIVALVGPGYLFVAYAEAIMVLALIIGGFVVLKDHIRWQFDRHYVRRLSAYGLPLIAYPVAMTMLSQSDRIIIGWYADARSVGLYGLAYYFASMPLLGSTAILNALQPSFFKAMNEGDHRRVIANGQVTFAIVASAVLLMAVWGDLVAGLLFPARYAEAFPVIAPVAIAGIPLLYFQIWVRVVIFSNRTVFLSILGMIAWLSNAALNIWLVPRYGYAAAAYTTLASYTLLALLTVFVIRRLELRSAISVRGWVLVPVALAACLFVAELPGASWAGLCLRAASTLLCLGLVYLCVRADLPPISALRRR